MNGCRPPDLDHPCSGRLSKSSKAASVGGLVHIQPLTETREIAPYRWVDPTKKDEIRRVLGQADFSFHSHRVTWNG
jgi:hypothetical protein